MKRCCRALLLLGFWHSALVAQPVTFALRDVAGNPVPDAVVYLTSESLAPAAAPARTIIDQRDERFVPRVSAAQTGADVEFPNSDTVSHHVYSFANPNAFELPLYKGEIRPAIRFDHPGLVILGCNIHDAMLGYLLVVDTPYFGVSNDAGQLVLDLPPGFYEVYAWSPALDGGKTQQLDDILVAASESSSRRLQLDLAGRWAATPEPRGSSLSWSDY